MTEHDNILVNGPFIAYQSVDTQFIGGKHTHNYPAPDTPHPTDHRIIEDIDFEDLSSSVNPEIIVPTAGKESHSGSLYPFVVPAKLAELNLYSMAEFEKMYRAAAAKEAPDLAQFLKQYKQLGVLDFGRLNKKQIFETLQAFFPNEIHYLYNNFIYYF